MQDVLLGILVFVVEPKLSRLPHRSCNKRTRLWAFDNSRRDYQDLSTPRNDPYLVGLHICTLEAHPLAGSVVDIGHCGKKIVYKICQRR